MPDIFCIHPMKTGMTSLTRFLNRFVTDNKINKHVFSAGHTTPQEMSWNIEEGVGYFTSKFCIQWCRNPYDRLVSFYFHMRQVGGHVNFLCRRSSFKEFAMSEFITQIVVPQINYHTVDGIPIVSYLGRFENYPVDVGRLFPIILPEHIDTLMSTWLVAPRMFQTEHEDYRSYYDKETQEYIYNQFKEDFVYFNYQEAL